MLKLKISRVIPTIRSAKSFRSMRNSTGYTGKNQDTARVLLEQKRLSKRQIRKAAVNEQWNDHYAAVTRELPTLHVNTGVKHNSKTVHLRNEK